MLRLAIGAAAVAAFLAWGLWQRVAWVRAEARAEAAEAVAAALEVERDRARQAADVHRAAVVRMAAEAALAEASEDEVRGMDGAGAPVSDYLRAVRERLQ